MQRVTATDQMHMFSTNMTNLTELNSKRGVSLNNIDSSRGERREYQMRDMLNLLEIKTNTKKMLHAPSLQTFILRRFQKTASMSKKRMYMLLRAWRRIVRAEGGFVVDFVECMGVPDKSLLRYVAHRLLDGLRELSRHAFYPKYIKPADVHFDKSFELKIGFVKVK